MQLEIPAAWERRNERWKQLTVHNELFPILRHAVQSASLQQVESELVRWHEEFVVYQPDSVKMQWEIVQKWLVCAQIAALDRQTVGQFPGLLGKLDAQIELPDDVADQSAIEDPARWSQFVRQTIYGLNQTVLQQTIWACDVIASLTGHPRPVAQIETIPVLLRSSDGEVAALTLELLADDGMGILYPNPSTMSFVTRNQEFQQAEKNALSWLRSLGFVGDQKQFDMRWSVTRRTGRPLDRLEGGSLGGAFALGFAKLWLHLKQVPAVQGLKDLDLSGTAITAEIHPTGKLSPIAGEHEKLIAAAHKKSFPRIHTIVVSRQQLDIEQELHHDFVIHRLDTMSEVVRTLVAESQTRWKGTDCILPARNPDFTGRQHLLEEVQNFIADHESGYLCITGMRGSGKSAFLTEYIYRSRDRGDEPVYHKIDKSNPTTCRLSSIATCLYDRLRRKYTILEPPEWQRLPPVDKLKRLLLLVSQDELQGGQKEILYIDGAEQIEGNAKYTQVIELIGMLPPGVFCIMTAQPNITGADTQSSITIWNIHEFVDDRSDVRALLLKKREQLPQNWHLTDTFVEQIVAGDRAPNLETVTGCLYQLQNRNERESKKEWLTKDPNPWWAPPGHNPPPPPPEQLPKKFIITMAAIVLLTAFFAITATFSEPFRDLLPYEVAHLFVPESCDGSQDEDAPLILIFDFDKLKDSPSIYDRIEKRLYDTIVEMEEGIEVCHVEKKFNSEVDARQWGERRGATLVIWGSVRGVLEASVTVVNQEVKLDTLVWSHEVATASNFLTKFELFINILVKLGLSKIYYFDENISVAQEILITILEEKSSFDNAFIENESIGHALGEAYSFLGELLYLYEPSYQDKRDSVQAYTKALEYDDSLNWIYLNLGDIYKDLGEDESAILALTKLIGQGCSPDNSVQNNSLKAFAFASRGEIKMTLGRSAEAIQDLTEAVECERGNVYTRFFLGEIQIQSGEVAEAEETFRTALNYICQEKQEYFIEELTVLRSKYLQFRLTIDELIMELHSETPRLAC